MSLKSTLNQIIKDRKGSIFTLNELEDYCHKNNYKLSNAERRLRRSESPDIEPVYNKEHTAIIGYRCIPEPMVVGQEYYGGIRYYPTIDVEPFDIVIERDPVQRRIF